MIADEHDDTRYRLDARQQQIAAAEATLKELPTDILKARSDRGLLAAHTARL